MGIIGLSHLGQEKAALERCSARQTRADWDRVSRFGHLLVKQQFEPLPPSHADQIVHAFKADKRQCRDDCGA